MAECNHLGEVRALANYETDPRFGEATDSSTVLAALVNPVLFINIEPEHGERYQGIVPLDQANLAGCLMQYYDLSAQIPTELYWQAPHSVQVVCSFSYYLVMMRKSKNWLMKIYGHV